MAISDLHPEDIDLIAEALTNYIDFTKNFGVELADDEKERQDNLATIAETEKLLNKLGRCECCGKTIEACNSEEAEIAEHYEQGD